MSYHRTVTPTAPDLLARARALGPTIVEHADAGERARRLPEPTIDAFADAGLFRLSVPATLGGSEAPLSTQLQVVEEVARHDGSAGWCVMIHATCSVLCGHLPDDVVVELFGGGPRDAVCGVYAPKGRAKPAEGGVAVTGRWSFASGCQHARWCLGGVLIPGEAAPQFALAIFDANDIRIHDTWHVAGLRGTGSHDFEVRDAFVPRRRVVDLSAPPRRDAPLYRMPLFGVLAAEVAAVSLGIARAAIDGFVALASEKTPAGSARTLAQRGTIQLAVADARAELDAGRAYLVQTVQRCEDTLAHAEALDLDARVALRLAAAHAVRCATAAVDRMYEAGGGTALYETSPLQRHFRDAHAATQHVMVASGVRELVGRHLVGLPIDTTTL